VLFHGNACLHTAVRTGALLEHFNWEFFDNLPQSSNLAPSDYHLFTYLKKWLRSQRFNNNEELMEGVKMWLSSQAATSLTQAYRNLFSDMTSASILAVAMLRSSSSMCIFLAYNNTFFSLLVLLTACVLEVKLFVIYMIKKIIGHSSNLPDNSKK
jgi:hypothetical protein